MCNHYEKNSDVVAMAVSIVNNWAISPEGDVVVPDDLSQYPDHTWPKAQAPVVIQTESGRAIASMRWGVRVEVKGAGGKPLTKFVTNARDDKFSGYTWKWSVAQRRCLIPAVSYFEPDGPDGAKWEVRFTLKDRPMFFLAGLWDTDPDGLTRSFTMVTTSPNELAAQLHDRMPAVLTNDGARLWLGHTPLATDEVKRLIVPYPAVEMTSVALPPPSREKKVTKEDLKATQGELLF